MATVKSPRQRKPDHSDDAAFCETKLTALTEHPTTLKHLDLLACGDFETTAFPTLSAKSASRKTQKPTCEIWILKAACLMQMSLDFDDF